MTDDMTKCVQPAGGPIGIPKAEEAAPSNSQTERDVTIITAKVGQSAPDFEANAYVDGGFKNVTLSHFLH